MSIAGSSTSLQSVDAGRYGGEEFVLVFRGATAAAAVTVVDPVALLDAADKRLYEAKRLGRDRTVS